MQNALIFIAVLVTIAVCIGLRILTVAIVEHGGIGAGLVTIALVFALGYVAAPYLD